MRKSRFSEEQIVKIQEEAQPAVIPREVNLITGNSFHFKPFNFTLTPNIARKLS